MNVTPLHFSSRQDGNRHPLYGLSIYYTDCNRFTIFKQPFEPVPGCDVTWRLSGGPSIWRDWLNDRGMISEAFPTRVAALTALSEALKQTGLIDAQVPPST